MKNHGSRYSGVKVLVMGLGLNGGGLPAALYLGRQGAELCVTDLRDEKTLAPSIKKLEAELPGAGRIRYVLGCHETADFRNADLVIKNPGVRPDSPYLLAARRVETDISLFLAASQARLCGITGSKGKSSTASAIHHVLEEWHEAKAPAASGAAGAPKAWLGGNITLSPLSFLDELHEGDDVILELSSWQLGDLKGRKNESPGKNLLKPRAAVLSAIMPDHLDRYGNMDAYIADKRIIYQGQDQKDVTVAGDDSWGQSFRSESRGRGLVYSGVPLPPGVAGGWIDPAGERGLARAWEGLETLTAGDIAEVVPGRLLVPGKHQKINFLSAGLTLLDLGVPADFIRDSIGRFRGIEHRLEFFHESGGIRFYNDSAATIPEAAAAAIKAFDKPPIVICGGADKNLDFSPLVTAAAWADSIILLEGSASAKLSSLLKAAGIAFNGPFNSLEAAATAALEKTRSNSVVILSPGCASFGMFLNEFDRGAKWKEAARRLCP